MAEALTAIGVVRAVDPDDYEQVFRLADAHMRATEHRGTIEPAHAAQSWRELHAEACANIFGLYVGDALEGYLGALLDASIFEPVMQATAIGWVVHLPARRGLLSVKLIEAFEVWARERGAQRIILSGFHDRAWGRYFARRGYVTNTNVQFIRG